MRKLGAGIAGGMLAGALVGALEAVLVWTGRVDRAALPPLGWAVVVYGLVGGTAGLGAGILARFLGTDAYGLALGSIAAGLVFVVARDRIVRDVFFEQAPQGLLPALVQAAALTVLTVGAVLVWRALRGADARRALLTRPGVVAALVALVGLGWSLAQRRLPAPAPAVATGRAPAGAPNVLLVVVDSLRADRLAPYDGPIATPNLSALAGDGIVFRHTFAQASWTRPSIATILTGLYPSSHGAIGPTDVLSPGVDTVAEEIAQGGYYTAGFAAAADVSPAFGFGQGFAEYHYLAPERFFWADGAATDLTLYGVLRAVRARLFARSLNVRAYYRPAEDVVATARGWLDGPAVGGQPFFLFLHFMDPHEPYMVHPFDGIGYAREAIPSPSPDMVDTLRATYDGEIRYVDEQLGVLVADLKRRGLYDNMLIVVTADHGEEFHEHGGWWHGTTLYDEQIAVPLIVKPPSGGIRGRVVDAFATSLDVAPTILRAAGREPPAVMQGHALPLDAGPVPPRESVFAEEHRGGNVLRAVRTKAWKLITANAGNPRGLAPEALYDVARDPGETRNVAAAAPETAEEMQAALGRSILTARAHAGERTEQAGIDPETERRLKELGYLK